MPLTFQVTSEWLTHSLPVPHWLFPKTISCYYCRHIQHRSPWCHTDRTYHIIQPCYYQIQHAVFGVPFCCSVLILSEHIRINSSASESIWSRSLSLIPEDLETRCLEGHTTPTHSILCLLPHSFSSWCLQARHLAPVHTWYQQQANHTSLRKNQD